MNDGCMVAARCGGLFFVRGSDTFPPYRLLRALARSHECRLPHTRLLGIKGSHVLPAAAAPHVERAVVPDRRRPYPGLGERLGREESRVRGKHSPSLGEYAPSEVEDVEGASWRGVTPYASVDRRARGELAAIDDEDAGLCNSDCVGRTRKERRLGKKEPVGLGHR